MKNGTSLVPSIYITITLHSTNILVMVINLAILKPLQMAVFEQCGVF